MSKMRRSTLLISAMWGIAGFALGASAALLWIGKLKPEWVEATGTWFGAIATVLAVLWAVRTFRSDQAEREQARRDEADRSARASELAAAAVKAEAGRVAIEVRGAAGYGNAGEYRMTSVHLDIYNGAAQAIDELQIRTLPPLQLKKGPRVPVRVVPGETWTEQVEVEDIDVEAHELSGHSSPRFVAEGRYRLDGRTWLRLSDGGEPRLLQQSGD